MTGGATGVPPKDKAHEGILWYIKNSGLTGGGKLPPERELAEMLGVSRTALRAAITKLISTHVLESKQGSGTYVLPPKPINVFQKTYNFSDAVRRAGREPGSRLVSARMDAVDGELAPKIELEVGAPVFMMSRVRLADGEPVALETAYVNYALCPGIERHNFGEESLYDVLASEYNVHVGHGSERISIARAHKAEAELLSIEEGEPVFFESAIERDAAGITVEYMKAVIVPSRYRFASDSSARGVRAGESDSVRDAWLTW